MGGKEKKAVTSVSTSFTQPNASSSRAIRKHSENHLTKFLEQSELGLNFFLGIRCAALAIGPCKHAHVSSDPTGANSKLRQRHICTSSHLRLPHTHEFCLISHRNVCCAHTELILQARNPRASRPEVETRGPGSDAVLGLNGVHKYTLPVLYNVCNFWNFH